MAIEKVFAVEASQVEIWDALWADLSEGDSAAYSLEGSAWPSRLELEVSLGGVRANIVYRIEEQPDHCVVSATLVPVSRRYGLYYLLTLGQVRRNYETLLATGLANLKATVEASDRPAAGPGAAGE